VQIYINSRNYLEFFCIFLVEKRECRLSLSAFRGRRVLLCVGDGEIDGGVLIVRQDDGIAFAAFANTDIVDAQGEECLSLGTVERGASFSARKNNEKVKKNFAS
jgi:hypothetical protein